MQNYYAREYLNDYLEVRFQITFENNVLGGLTDNKVLRPY